MGSTCEEPRACSLQGPATSTQDKASRQDEQGQTPELHHSHYPQLRGPVLQRPASVWCQQPTPRERKASCSHYWQNGDKQWQAIPCPFIKTPRRNPPAAPRPKAFALHLSNEGDGACGHWTRETLWSPDTLSITAGPGLSLAPTYIVPTYFQYCCFVPLHYYKLI